jgi:hypothetical protein
MIDDDAILERLDLIVAVLQLAHDDAIGRVRGQIRADPVSAAIIDACSDGWATPAVVRAYVDKTVGATPARTFQRRLRELLTRGALRERGATHTKSYRSTGLI